MAVLHRPYPWPARRHSETTKDGRKQNQKMTMTQTLPVFVSMFMSAWAVGFISGVVVAYVRGWRPIATK